MQSNDGDLIQLVFVQHLDAGLWYTFVYNDSPFPQLVHFETASHGNQYLIVLLNYRGRCGPQPNSSPSVRGYLKNKKTKTRVTPKCVETFAVSTPL